MLNELIKPKAFGDLHQSFFLTLGKSLYLAQDFENLCRSLMNLVDIKKSIYAGETSIEDESFNKLFDKLKKRMLGDAIKDFSKVPGTPPEVKNVLDDARVARNAIAHGTALLINHPFGDEDVVWDALRELYSHVKHITTAHAFLAACLYWQNEHETLTIPYSYESDVLSWVFSEFSADDLEYIQG